MIRVAGLLMLVAGVSAGTEPPAAPSDGDDPFAHNNCVQCHRDLPGRSSELVALEWEKSVHHAAGVACDGCHGGNASVRREQFDSDEAFKAAAHLQRNPEFLLMHGEQREFVSSARGRSVSYFCGQCHSQIKEKHLGSPHGDFGDPTCLYCHGQGSHKITDATPAIIDVRSASEGGRCSRCHAEGTMEAVGRIKKLLIETEQRIDSSGRKYAELEDWGYRNLELEGLHHHVGEVHSRLRQIFHSFNMREINNFAAEIEEVADRTDATHDLVANLRASQHRQSIIGVVVACMLLCFAGLLVYYKKAFLPHRGI